MGLQKKRILIVGASSFIGYRLYQYLESSSKYELYGTYYKHKKNVSFKYCDILDKVQIDGLLRETKPDIILWLAGSKNLKECDESLDFAKNINTLPIKHCIDSMKNNKLFDCRLIFFSTDYVFDGSRGHYKYSDVTNPKTNYGISNLLAENFIIKSDLMYTIIRTSAVMGKGGTFFDWLVNGLKNEKKIELFDDIYFSPTPIKFLCEILIKLINLNNCGIFHICGNYRISRYEFAMILKSLNKKFPAELVPVLGMSISKFFQADLSLLPSDICSFENKKFEDYLLEELDD